MTRVIQPPKDPIDPGRAPIEQSGEPPDDPKDTPPAPGRPIDRGGKTGFLGALGEALILAAILMLLAGHIFINALGWGA